MKVNSNLIIDISRSADGFLSGHFVLNGVMQKVNVIPKGIELEDLNKFFANHVVPMIEAGKHGSLSYKKSANFRM